MRVEIQAGDQRWQMPVGSTGQWSRQISPRQRRFHYHYVQRSLQRRDHRRAVLRVKLSLTIYPTMANFTSPAAACSSSQPTRAGPACRLNPDQNQLNRPGTGAVRPGCMDQSAMHQAGVRNKRHRLKRRLLAHSLVAAVMGMILLHSGLCHRPGSILFDFRSVLTTITSGDRTNQYDYWFRPARRGAKSPACYG